MMAPEALEPASVQLVRQRTEPSRASEPAAVDSKGRATLRGHFSRQEQQRRPLQPAATAEHSSATSESEVEDDNNSSQSGDRREHAEEVGSEAGKASDQSPELAVLVPRRQDDEQEPPVRGSESTVTAEIIAARRTAMFVVGTAEPQSSGLPPLASEATKAIVRLAAKDMEDLAPKGYGRGAIAVVWQLGSDSRARLAHR